MRRRYAPEARRTKWITGPQAVAWGLALALIMRKTVFQRGRSGLLDYARVDTHAAFEIALIGLAVLVVLTSRRLFSLLHRLNGTSGKLFLAYYAIGIVSALWSAQPAYSGYKALEVLSQVLLVFMALSLCRDFRQAEKHVLVVSAVSALLGMCLVVKYHGLSFNLQAWHTNQYTISAAMIACYSGSEIMRATGQRRRLLKASCALGLLIVVVGTSAASIISMIAGLALAAFLLRGTRWPLVAVLSMAGLFALISPDKAMTLIFPNKTEKQITTLRGRTDMWTELTTFAQQRPVLGYGFAMGAKLGEHQNTNTHNAFFAVLLGTGLIGVTVTFLAGLKFCREAVVRLRSGQPGAVGCTCALAAGTINSMSMAFLGESWALPSLAFACFLGLHMFHIKGSSARVRVRSQPGTRRSTGLYVRSNSGARRVSHG